MIYLRMLNIRRTKMHIYCRQMLKREKQSIMEVLKAAIIGAFSMCTSLLKKYSSDPFQIWHMN